MQVSFPPPSTCPGAGSPEAAAQVQPAPGAPFLVAQRAEARVLAVGAFGEEVVGQEGVEHRRDVRRFLLHHLVGLRLEVLPERFEDRLPLGAAAGDIVELFLHASREVVGDIGGEEAFEEGGQQTARFLGEEAVLVDPHIFAVAQSLDGRCVGRRAPDAELLQLLDQRCLGKAGRRLGEVLVGLDALARRRIAFAHQRQQAAI